MKTKTRMGLTDLFQRAMVSSNNVVRAACLEELDRALERGPEQHDPRPANTCDRSTAKLSAWIDETIRPNAFVTLLLPFNPGLRPADNRRVRDHQFYLRLWTRKAERALWGARRSAEFQPATGVGSSSCKKRFDSIGRRTAGCNG